MVCILSYSYSAEYREKDIRTGVKFEIYSLIHLLIKKFTLTTGITIFITIINIINVSMPISDTDET